MEALLFAILGFFVLGFLLVLGVMGLSTASAVFQVLTRTRRPALSGHLT